MTLITPGFRMWLPFLGRSDSESVDESGKARLLLASLIVNGEWQERTGMIAHPILMDVAQARAVFVANVADIFAYDDVHTWPEDRRTPNQWVREAGYGLPDWYDEGGRVRRNSVESNATGYRDRDGEKVGAAVVKAWLGSEQHSAHLRGEGAFFGAQVHYGVGVVFVGRYKPAWVFISAH